jgi:hypothetical protein
MKNWLQKNVKNIIITAFVIPILLVALVSISHVTSFYGLSNPVTWAVYLSVGIEIAALSALAAVSVNMGRFVYLPFFVVTLIQMIGNIFYSFSYIDETGQQFQDWVNMVGGLFENMGIEKTDLNTHKTIVAFLSGGLLPVISLTFAHMLVKFSEQKSEETLEQKEVLSEDEFKEILKKRRENSEEEKWTPTQEEIDILEKVLSQNYDGPLKEEVKEEPINPTEEQLQELDKVLENFYNKDVDEVEEDKQEEPTPEPQKEPEIDLTTEEVEKKNDISEPTNQTEERGDENYKVLNYSNRNA